MDTILLEILVVVLLSGVSGIVLKVKDIMKELMDPSTETKEKQAKKLIIYSYAVEFAFSSLAGIMVYAFFEPVNWKQIIAFSILVGLNAENVIDKTGQWIKPKKEDALNTIDNDKEKLIEEPRKDESDEEGNSSN